MLAKVIAIIDDEIDLVNLFQEALENNGFKVCTFIDPVQALNTLEKKIQEYILILLIIICLSLTVMTYVPN
jgi:DNA-binding NtrC family response regulator